MRRGFIKNPCPATRLTLWFSSFTPGASPVHLLYVLLSTGGGRKCLSFIPSAPSVSQLGFEAIHMYIIQAEANRNTVHAVAFSGQSEPRGVILYSTSAASQRMFNYCAQHPLECCMIAPLREAIWYCTLHREPKGIAHSREEHWVNRMQSASGEGEGRS